MGVEPDPVGSFGPAAFFPTGIPASGEARPQPFCIRHSVCYF